MFVGGALSSALLFQNCGGGFSALSVAPKAHINTSISDEELKRAGDNTFYDQMTAAQPEEVARASRASRSDGKMRSQTLTSANSCRPVRKYSYTVPSDVSLTCGEAGFVQVFQQSVSDTGRALVRSKLIIKGTGAIASKVHGWSGYTMVGNAINAFQTGEDICNGESLIRQMFGYGTFSSINSTISIMMKSYRSNDCDNGSVTIGAGSTVEVWVEDAASECQEKDIHVYSYRRAIGDIPLGILTSVTPVLSTGFTVPVSGRLTLLGQTEITPSSTFNACNNRTEIAYAWMTYQGQNVGQVSDGFAPSQGLSHVLLSTEYVIENHQPGQISYGLAAAVNNTYRAAVVPQTPITSPVAIAGHYMGSFIGYPETGDNFVAAVLERTVASAADPSPPSGSSDSATPAKNDSIPSDEIKPTPPSTDPVITAGKGSCSGTCGWVTDSKLDIRCQYQSEYPSGKQLSGSCEDEDATNTYEWAREQGKCASGTLVREKVVQRCKQLQPKSGSSKKTFHWVTVSDTAIRCQYMSEAPVGRQVSGACYVENQVNEYEWGTGVPGGCNSPTFLRHRVIQKCLAD